MNRTWFVRRTSCPVCESGKFSTIYGSPYDRDPLKSYLRDFYAPQGRVEWECLAGAKYDLCECEGCSALFQRDIPNDALMERLYEHWIDPDIAFEAQATNDSLGHRVGMAQEIMQISAFLGKPPSALRFLDYGMGWSKWALMAKGFGCDSSGTELSPSRIRNARNHGVRVIAGDDLPEQHYDFVNTEQVFEHLPDPLATLRKLKPSLRAGGVVRISVPTARNIKRQLRMPDWGAEKNTRTSLNPVAPLEHINCFTRASLLEMASVAGFSEVSIPLKIQLKYATDWSGPGIIKNIVRPIWMSCFPHDRCILLQISG